MRKSQKYNNYVHPETGAEETISLAKHYQYSSHLGDQVSIFSEDKIKLHTNLILYEYRGSSIIGTSINVILAIPGFIKNSK